jgi:glycyl-tRNA synthetase (class II)
MAQRSDRMETIVSLSKRRGIVYPSSEIYGGLRAAWDYGPLGVEIKNNIKRQWWRSMVQARDDIVGIDSSVILATEVWQASGHVTQFTDPLTECQSCHFRFRADHLMEAYEEKHDGRPPEHGLADLSCPHCGTKGQFTEPRQFNGMLRTYLGATEDESGLAYLRPETAQGIFINYRNVLQTSRKKIPFGIGQIGKSFRNEITPGNFIFRTREFEQMEMEFFVKPGTDEEWHEPGEPAPLRAHGGEAVVLLQADRRPGVPVRLPGQRVGRARGHREPDRLRPRRARQGLRPGPELPRPGDQRAVHPVRHRASRRGRPLGSRVPARGLCRGRGA